MKVLMEVFMRTFVVKALALVSAVFLFAGCTGIPDGVTPVNNFDVTKYQGTWYEVARLDHSFERGMDQVTANYQLNDDGDVVVTNRGFRVDDNGWEEAIGKAKFVDATDEGYLKVSFFGPFYGSYIVFDLDHEDYQYSFVSGPNLSYLWLLSRTKTVDPKVMESFIKQAKAIGFDTQELIMVNQ